MAFCCTLRRLMMGLILPICRSRGCGTTPRKFVVHPETNLLVVAEADHAAVPLLERSAGANGMDAEGAGAAPQVRLHAPRYSACMFRNRSAHQPTIS